MKKHSIKRHFRLLVPFLLFFLGALLAPELKAPTSDNTSQTERLEGSYASPLANSPSARKQDTLSKDSESMMEVHFIDVGDGDATLIKCGKHAMLIDTGDTSKGTAIQHYLQKQGVKTLDYLILTHPDADHIGGAPVVLTKFTVDTVFVSNYEKDNQTYQKLIQALDDQSLSSSTPVVGSQYTLGSATFTILGPLKEYATPNDASIALILQNGENKFLFTGDAESAAEKDLLKSDMDLTADVYQAGHHGSNTSSSSELLHIVAPSYAVISCGENNSYGHPRAETLNNLRKYGVQVFRTDEQGSVVATSDGKCITWNCAPSETWKAGEPTTEASSSSVIAPEQKETVSASLTYVLNTKTKKFHIASCSSLPTTNRQDTTLSRDEVIAQGYVPCKRCM